MRKFSLGLGVLALASAIGCGSSPHSPECPACKNGTHGMTTLPVAADTHGMAVVPAADVAVPTYTGDLGPAQVFEITRPDNGPVTLGRLSMNCFCVTAETLEKGKNSYAAGERALVVVRQVAPKQAPSFTLTVQVVAPKAAILTAPVDLH